MSKEALTKVIQRSIGDAAFRRQLSTDASGALRGYDLTADEINAMRSRDVAKLTAFGIDVRMSKVFTLDPGAMGDATLTSGSEPRDVAPVWVGDGSNLPTGSEPRDIAPMWVGDASSVHTYSGDEGQLTNDSPGADINLTTGGGDIHQQ